MATRPRTSGSRSKKASLPLTTTPPTAVGQSSTEEALQDAATGSGEPAARTAGAEPLVRSSRLERREIPSFSPSREARIAEAAYWRAERRGFTAGHELDDWLAAEREIDGQLAAAPGAARDSFDSSGEDPRSSL